MYGSWTIGPSEDTRSQVEKDTEVGESPPEAYGCWRVRPQEPTKPRSAGRRADRSRHGKASDRAEEEDAAG